MEYLDLFRSLSKGDIRYLICGGLAVNIYGIPRMTADIDILLDFEEGNVTRFESAIKLLLYRSVAPVSLRSFVDKNTRAKVVSEKNMIAYSYYNSRSNYMNVDVLMDTPFAFSELWDRRSTRPMDDFSIQLVSVEDLIEMKKYANRKQDVDDVLLLSKLLNK